MQPSNESSPIGLQQSGSRKSSSKGSRSGRRSANGGGDAKVVVKHHQTTTTIATTATTANPAGQPQQQANLLSAADATRQQIGFASNGLNSPGGVYSANMLTPSSAVYSSPAPATTQVAARGVPLSGSNIQQQHTTTTTTTAGMHHLQTPQQIHQNSDSQQRFVSSASGTERVISERFIEHEIKVPKRVLREDVIEKFVVVPEKVVREEIVDDIVRVKEKIIEVAKPVIQEKVVEVPEYEYVEKIVEVPEKVYKEKIREVPTVQYEERVVEVPKIVTQERVVEVPQIQYRDVPVQKIVEVPEIEERVVVKEVPVPQYIEKPTPEYVEVEVAQEVEHNVPVPVEAVTKFGYRLPKLQPRYNQVELTLYVPRFVEVPVPAEFMEEAHREQAHQFAAQVNILANQRAAGLGEVESLAGAIKSADFGGVFSGRDNTQVLSSAWGQGKLGVGGQQQRHVPGMYGGAMNMQTQPSMQFPSQAQAIHPGS